MKAKPARKRKPSLAQILARAHARDDELRRARARYRKLAAAKKKTETKRKKAVKKLSQVERENRALKKKLRAAREKDRRDREEEKLVLKEQAALHRKELRRARDKEKRERQKQEARFIEEQKNQEARLVEERQKQEERLIDERRKGRREAIEQFLADIAKGEEVGPQHRIEATWREVEALRKISTPRYPFKEAIEDWAIRNNFSVSQVWAEYRKRHPWRGGARGVA